METVAWWPHTSSQQIASARLRCFQVVEELRRQGIAAEIYRLGQKPPSTLVLSKKYDDDAIRHALTLRKSAGTRLVLDLCDNHFYSSNPDPRWEARARSLKAAVPLMDLIVASTPTLARHIEVECPEHPAIVVVGDAVEDPSQVSWNQKLRSPWAELKLARLRSQIESSGIADGRRLLWFGNHGSGNAEGGMADLLLVGNHLARASSHEPLSLTVISNSSTRYRQIAAELPVQTFYLDWHSTTFSRAAQLHDIALIPVGRNPFTICKTNNRLATAFMHGLAVVAHAIPSYEEFSDSAILDDWDALELLMADRANRDARTRLGRQSIEARWNRAHIAAQWLQALGLGEQGSSR